MSRIMSIVLLSLALSPGQNLYAKDYILTLEMSTETETKIGDAEASKESEVRTIEMLINTQHRFQGKTTWGKERLLLKGNLTEAEDGIFHLHLDFGHFRKTGTFVVKTFGGPKDEIENKSAGNTTIGVKLGEPQELGGSSTTATCTTPDGERVEKHKVLFKATLVADEPAES